MVMQIRFENKIFLLVKEIFEMLPMRPKTNWWNIGLTPTGISGTLHQDQ